MSRIALITASAIALAGCATSSPYGYSGTGMSAQSVNCGAGVVGGAVLGGLAGNQIGKGTGQDVATIAGATVGGLLGATRQTCQPQAYGQQGVYGQPAYGNPQPVLAGYDRYGRPVYR
jgi:outer membrane lipoprotein SlyB